MALRKQPSRRMRLEVEERARAVCEYCYSQQVYSPSPFVCDHIIPVSMDGETTVANLAYACDGCNGKKHNIVRAIDPLTGETVPLYHPRTDLWREHFRWSDDFLTLIGVSPSGRATIEKLTLNRPYVINLRRVLLAFKEHPPEPIDDP